jgi:hypothetical protein
MDSDRIVGKLLSQFEKKLMKVKFMGQVSFFLRGFYLLTMDGISKLVLFDLHLCLNYVQDFLN